MPLNQGPEQTPNIHEFFDLPPDPYIPFSVGDASGLMVPCITFEETGEDKEHLAYLARRGLERHALIDAAYGAHGRVVPRQDHQLTGNICSPYARALHTIESEERDGVLPPGSLSDATDAVFKNSLESSPVWYAYVLREIAAESPPAV